MINQIQTQDGSMQTPDNHPPATWRNWAVQTRAAKIQQKNALQEQIRGIGIEIAALDKVIEKEEEETR